MAQLNIKETVRTHEGAPGLKFKPLDELRRAVLSCLLWEDQFYESGEAIADRIRSLCKQVHNLNAIAELALEARREYNLRHAPLLLVNELINARFFAVDALIEDVVQRPDEMGELISIYWADGGKRPLAAKLKKGLAAAFDKFDAYQLAKYKSGKNKAITLKDVMCLVHPKPPEGSA